MCQKLFCQMVNKQLKLISSIIGQIIASQAWSKPLYDMTPLLPPMYLRFFVRLRIFSARRLSCLFSLDHDSCSSSNRDFSSTLLKCVAASLSYLPLKSLRRWIVFKILASNLGRCNDVDRDRSHLLCIECTRPKCSKYTGHSVPPFCCPLALLLGKMATSCKMTRMITLLIFMIFCNK